MHKTLSILLAAVVASAPVLCCCILPMDQNAQASMALTATQIDRHDCCPERDFQKSCPKPSDESSCSCNKTLVLAAGSSAPAMVIPDSVQLPIPLATAFPVPDDVAQPVLHAHLTCHKALQDFRGESLHALSCLFT